MIVQYVEQIASLFLLPDLKRARAFETFNPARLRRSFLRKLTLTISVGGPFQVSCETGTSMEQLVKMDRLKQRIQVTLI